MGVFNYRYDDFFEPTIKSLHILGGSASVQEIEECIIGLMNISDEKISEIHNANVSKLSYQLAWAREYLKMSGFIDKSRQGIFSLTTLGINSNQIDKEEVNSFVKVNFADHLYHDDWDIEDRVENFIVQMDWQQKVLELIKSIPPQKFERLCQRLLRELGFVNVEVTGKVGDGGIDGKGVFRIGGLMSFHVVFQCKRYSGAVSSSAIRDFRGAFIGRAEKGLFITTGNFTRDARREAQRDGAPPVDLVDGLELAEKLKELKLGVETELIERINVNVNWFNNF
ncbi:restriction endonuclease [Pedobacter mucosus]|uniref:restriction endonuclease n=1 Tax=Pedobacter mucosus TaxID=2895286 RepID=UPI001EE3C940|nr:restriction endonuclease [Pedobacter mucosus]UKT65056.1 restriction endonuclease [Pedobacter mucosus]